MVQDHRDLIVWQKAIDLVVECYQLSKGFPESERFSLTSQFRRAAVSVPANIAEGRGRGTPKGFLQFLSIATGSLAELDTHLELAVRLQLVTEDSQVALRSRINEIGRMITGLRHSIRRNL